MPSNFPFSQPLYHFRKWFCSLLVLALFSSSLLSSIVVLNPQYFEKQAGWLTGDNVLVCTSEGLKWVSVASLERHSNHHGHEEHSSFNAHCPVFKLHDGKGFIFEGAYNFVGFIQFVGHIGNIESQYHGLTNKLYRFAPKHSPPMAT